MLRIGIDLDGCLYDFEASLKYFLVKHVDAGLWDLPEPSCWDFYESDWGMTETEFMSYFEDGVNSGIVFAYGGVDPGGAECLEKLSTDHSIHIVTHRQIGLLSASNTEAWLIKNEITYDTLTFSKDKTVVKTDVFIEDNVDNFLALEESGVRSFLMDRPWNRHYHTPYRVYGWDEFYNNIKEYELAW